MTRNHLARLNRLARKQRGLFTLDQLLDRGWPSTTIRGWLEKRIWEEVAPRVYRYPTTALTWEDKLLAEILSSSSVAFRRSAGALYEVAHPPKTPQLLVKRTRRNLERDDLHSTTILPDSDITRVGVIPATMPSRTVIDIASELTSSDVDGLVDRALLRRLVRPDGLARRARDLRCPARPGAARVLKALDTLHPDLNDARNEWEALVLRFCREFGLPTPTPNFPIIVGGQRRILDVAWAPALVDLEYDGYEPHMETRKVFDDDRARQNDLVDADWKVFRVTSRMLKTNPERVFAPIVRAVSQRWPTGGTSVGHSGLAS